MASSPNRIWGILLAVGSILLWSGCQKRPDANKAKESDSDKPSMSATWAAKTYDKADSGNTGADTQTNSQSSKALDSSPALAIPKVGLTDSLRATCLVNVGDKMPVGEVFTTGGSTSSLQNQYGEKLTALFFWSQGSSNYTRLTANSALQDLQLDVAEPYAEKGVKVIGINVGDRPESAQQQFANSGAKYPLLFDPSGAFFSKVAKEKLPRIYLLDTSGKIIWFDTEYSRGTRRILMQAIQVTLGE